MPTVMSSIPTDPFGRLIYAIVMVGFPIVAAGVLAWMLNSNLKQTREDMKDQTTQTRQLVIDLQKSVNDIRDEMRQRRLAEELQNLRNRRDSR